MRLGQELRRLGRHSAIYGLGGLVSRILATLERAGYVERDERSGRFRLGLGLIALAGPLLADLDVRRVALGSLQQLTDRTGETSALMVWNGHESVVVEQVQSPKQVKHTAAIGTRYDTYESSSVKVFLAALPPSEVTRLFERRLLVGTYDAGGYDMSSVDTGMDAGTVDTTSYDSGYDDGTV